MRVLERRNLLTPLQINRLKAGETTGYYLGRFKVLYLISAGTFARVYRGIDSATGESVAIKVLRGRHTIDPENVRNFHREARLTEQLRHPNIARSLEVGCDDATSQHYIAMEFVEGGNFREFLRIRGKIEPRELARLALEMAEGLKFALSHGVTHRDIKPTNILFSSDGHIKWVDFGLAGMVEKGKAEPKPGQRTVDYAGLEKASGARNGDPRSDIFFLGAVLYEALTGEPPLAATKDKNQRMLKSRFDQIRPLVGRREVPAGLGRIVDKMLAVSPDNRYPSYDALTRDLENYLSAGEAASPSPDVPIVATGDPKPRVMIVHRNPRVSELLRKKLAGKGYRVALTTSMERAVNLVAIQKTDCMLVDLDTTGEEGLAALDGLLRASKAGGFAAILMADDHQARWAAQTDNPRVVTLKKPLTLGDVYKTVMQLVPTE